MTATTSKPRASTPRKQAARNGHSPAPVIRPPEPAPPLRPVVRETVSSPPETAAHHPYGDRDTFTWQPAGGGDPIILPHINTVQTTQEFFCKIYDLNEMFQSFEWMILAGVPKDIRIRVAALGDTDPRDQSNLFRSWFAPITRPQGLEPPGES